MIRHMSLRLYCSIFLDYVECIDSGILKDGRSELCGVDSNFMIDLIVHHVHCCLDEWKWR